MSFLVDREIRRCCQTNGLIDPFDEGALQPASYDVRLGDVFLVPRHDKVAAVDIGDRETFADLYETVQSDKFVLHPGEFALAATVERVAIPNTIVCRIEGRSSLARLGLQVHAAGFVDPGFRGNLTLECINMLRVPLVLRAGAAVAQLSFAWTSVKPENSYSGHYQDDDGPVASRYGS